MRRPWQVDGWLAHGFCSLLLFALTDDLFRRTTPADGGGDGTLQAFLNAVGAGRCRAVAEDLLGAARCAGSRMHKEGDEAGHKRGT